MNTTSKVLTGVLVGASVGIIAGILIAPDSGKRTREKLAGYDVFSLLRYAS